MSTNYGCAICCSVFSPTNNSKGLSAVALSTCGHSFHIDCVKIWFNTSRTCPICRTPGTDTDLLPMNLHVKKSNNISRPSFNAEEHQDIKTLTDEARELRCKLDRENNGMQKAKHYLGDIRRSIRHIFVEMEDNIPTIDLCDSIISESPNPTRTAPLNMSSSSNNPRASLQPRAGPSVPPLLRSTSSSSIPARALSGTRNVQVRVGATGTYTTIVTDRTKARPRTTASGASASSRLTSRAPFRNV